MSMARKRIILVGDHRQLPHLIQRELEDELVTKECLSAEQAKWARHATQTAIVSGVANLYSSLQMLDERLPCFLAL